MASDDDPSTVDRNPGSETVVDRFSDWARRAGDRPFLSAGEENQHFTYREFDEDTDRLAHRLLRTGVAPGQRVGVYAESALLCARAMFACWKLGAVYCPINSQLREDLLAGMIDDLQPHAIIVGAEAMEPLGAVTSKLTHREAALILFDGQTPASRVEGMTPTDDQQGDLGRFDGFAGRVGEQPTPVGVEIGSDTVCSIMYTSGTTRRPKGVMHTHRWLSGLGATLGHMTHPDDVIYSDLPLYHIGGAYTNVVRAAWAGASVALWNRFSASNFWRRIDQARPSIVTMLDVMLDRLWAAPPSRTERENSIIRVHMQPLRRRHAEVAKRFGIDFVCVGYGSTEVGVAFTGLIDEFGDTQATPKDLWKGFDKAEIGQRVIELAGKGAVIGPRKAPAGFMGAPVAHIHPRLEHSEGGEGAAQLSLRAGAPFVLSNAYFNDGAAREMMLGDGYFRTGDLVRQVKGGAYAFLERQEGMLRIRGENVSAVAIEEIIEAHASVLRCAVVGVPAAQGAEDDIAAFVVMRSDAP
ncbi:MAG: class I adenylate-forming enzyme family protein, partial [Pseudomonadota bacterium]